MLNFFSRSFVLSFVRMDIEFRKSIGLDLTCSFIGIFMQFIYAFVSSFPCIYIVANEKEKEEDEKEERREPK